MRAVVLVGGFGTRLRPLTLSTPKQMLPVGDRPMLEGVLGHLAGHGVDEVVLSLGYRPDAFTVAYPGAVCAGVRLTYAVEPEPLDTAGAIRFAAQHAAITERFLVVNGDVLTDFDVTALVATHERTGAEATIYLTQVADPSQFGVVPTDESGRVLAFVEKPPPGEEPTDLVNAGYYVLEPSVLGRIPDGRRVNVERETFPAMVADGTLFARADDAYWLDVGTPERYLQANLDVVDGARRRAAGAPDGLLVGAGAVIAPDARVGRSVIGEGARVDAGAVVDGSVLMAGVHVAADAVVDGSVVGAGATVGERARISDLSVVGDGIVVGAGAVLAGARVPDPEGSTG